MKKEIKIGIDLDGTYKRHREFFDNLIGEKYIITGRAKKEQKELEKQLPYPVFCTAPQELGRRDLDGDEVVATLETLWEEKARVITELEIDVYFDDDLRALRRIRDKNKEVALFLVY